MIVHNSKIISGGAQDALVRYRYRKEFGLTDRQMDEEPNDAVMLITKIWEMEHARNELEERRSKQRGQK